MMHECAVVMGSHFWIRFTEFFWKLLPGNWMKLETSHAGISQRGKIKRWDQSSHSIDTKLLVKLSSINQDTWLLFFSIPIIFTFRLHEANNLSIFLAQTVGQLEGNNIALHKQWYMCCVSGYVPCKMLQEMSIVMSDWWKSDLLQ